MEKVLLKKIVADPNNPRQMFAADKMHSLKESIKREGIISPLVVEKVGENYLLLDGERRFRAATELGLKEVPVVIETARSATDRLVRQFTVQEQHEAWTPIEKALALVKLSEELGVNLYDVCKLLNIPTSQATRYVAFSKFVDKETYLKSEIPLAFVSYINTVRNTAIRVTREALEEEFTKSDQKKLERRIIADIRKGEILKPSQLSRLAFAFQKAPKSIKEYMNNDKATADGLFIKSGAQGARALRNMSFNTSYLKNSIAMFMKHPDMEVPANTIKQLKEARDLVNEFIAKFEE